MSFPSLFAATYRASGPRLMSAIQSVKFHQRLALSRFALGLLLTVSCANPVIIPPPSQDHPPVININGFEVAGSGNVETPNVSSTSVVNIDVGMDLAINGTAKNPGGVKTFSMTITQKGQTLFKVDTTGTPDANNKVPDLLSIPGTDGQGGVGSTPLKPPTVEPIVVEATATNFNNQSSSLKVTYVPVAANLRGPIQIAYGFVLPRQPGQNLYAAQFPSTPFLANAGVSKNAF